MHKDYILNLIKTLLTCYTKILSALLLTAFIPCFAYSQSTYYIDGYHGGIWGHYPEWNTRFMADMLHKHPYWKINLEIEPETWDQAEKVDPTAYQDLKSMIAGPDYKGRIEYVNPAYAQSYLYNIDGESIIRQFSYGIKKLQQHFPGIAFTSYSSEEPCFTSALPQILQSFGIKYASLKNPNTCFGGYTQAHGGELVNWEGPDGTRILTVPRYAIEALEPKSTWQTIAWNNSPAYIDAAFKNGIKSPVGMTLQDAGWKGGPFLGNADAPRQKNQYVTWRDYFQMVQADAKPVWKVSQEDVKVSLVWGSQITQKIAQQVRLTENNLLGTEKFLSIANLLTGKAWPQAALDTAWRTLLLSQHHDCWIVPYNGAKGNTWADKVSVWTAKSNAIADSLITDAFQQNNSIKESSAKPVPFTVFNTQLQERDEIVAVAVPQSMAGNQIMVSDESGHKLSAQIITDSARQVKLLFNAAVPGFGFKRFYLSKSSISAIKGTHAVKLKNGNYKLETNLYTIILDPKKGGTISSLYAKEMHKEFADQHNIMKFNGLRGNFYQDGGFKTSYDSPVEVKIIENGPIRVKLQLTGKINQTVWTEMITLGQKQKIIDLDLNIDWKHNVGIGEDTPKGTYKMTDYHKAFYDDRNKLLAVFPLNLTGQKVYKNAPFDVTNSRLKNTFFSSWDSIKNNVVLNWVDVTDSKSKYGMALFTDHTTSYAHGENFPLGLTLQYSGMGLWGRDYTISGPTHVHYALMPHQGTWDEGKVWSASAQWNEPLMVYADQSNKLKSFGSLISTSSDGLMLTAAKADDKNLTIRIFNAEGGASEKSIRLNFDYDQAVLEELNGKEKGILPNASFTDKKNTIKLSIPKFGIRTIRFTNVILK